MVSATDEAIAAASADEGRSIVGRPALLLDHLDKGRYGHKRLLLGEFDCYPRDEVVFSKIRSYARCLLQQVFDRFSRFIPVVYEGWKCNTPQKLGALLR